MHERRALRLFIDGAILKPQLGGIATYIAELTSALARRPDVDVCIATSTTRGLDFPRSVEVIKLPESVRQFARRMVWRERSMGPLASSWNTTVLVAPTVELPVRRLPIPAILVVHDLGAVQAPELYGRLRWLRFSAGIPLACRRADHVVCVSHATLAALRGSFPKLDVPCTVIGEAGRMLPHRPRAPRSPPYILVVGTMLRHKNVRTLLTAMDYPAMQDVNLVLAGPISARERIVFDKWRAATNATRRITHLGYVDRERLAALYAEAAVVALPSLYEGFGLTLLEAMRCGAPSVASAIPAHREVGGDAALFVEEPLNAVDWANALGRVMHNQALSESLSRRASDLASRITWDLIAEQVTGLAQSVAAAHSR